MSRRITVTVIALAMLSVALPTGLAGHFSAGVQGAPGASADETPGDPTVPGPEHVGEDFEGETPYEIGTRTNCYDAEANATVDEVQRAITTHPFCGHLVYNDDLEVDTFLRDSPPDQDIRKVGDLEIGLFDVQRAYYVAAAGLSFCEPMCDDSEDEIPETGEQMPVAAQNQTWNAVHDTGSSLGLTQTGQEAHDEHADGRDNTYAAAFHPAHAGGIAQRSTDAWQMNGWSIPWHLEDFVGFIEDGEGNPVTPGDIDEAVEKAKNADPPQLPADATANVCGYTPDYTYVSNAETTLCFTPLNYNGPSEDDTDGPTFSGDDACSSPTYVCGPTSGAFWDSTFVCIGGCYGGDEQVDYVAWHWVIAPSEPLCGVTEPGFAVDADVDTSNAYIAHDLDVYTPLNALATGPTVAQNHVDDYADAFVDELPGLPSVTDTEEVYDAARDNTTVFNDDVLEPNHLGAEDYDIDDNSRDIHGDGVKVSREDPTPCEQLTSDESPETTDPWTNYVDNGVVNSRSASVYSGIGGVDEDPPDAGLYGDDTSQDEANDPTTDLYSTDGFVGIFTDKNDDGQYEQVVGADDSTDTFADSPYTRSDIEQTGAYPMVWDMRVTVEDGEVSPDEGNGCTLVSGDIVEQMVNASYGPNTGLAQAIYLNEPTVFTDGDLTDPQAIPYADGSNIYLLGSQAVRELWDGDTTHDNGTLIDAKVDDLVSELEDFVVEQHGVDRSTIQVHQPGADLELDSDYFNQCDKSTGGYTSQLSFSHTCEVDCSGDTIATMYTFEVTGDGTIGGGEIPTFPSSEDPYDFGTGGTWFDIDAFDGNADRVDQRGDPLPTGDE